jgi:TrmH family RNA methyltransferase
MKKLNQTELQTIRTITSSSNEEIKNIAKLGSTKERSLQGRFIAEGIRVCSTLLQAGFKPEQIYITNAEYADQIQHIVQERKITLVTEHVMEKMSQATTPSGVLGVFLIPNKPVVSKLSSGLVLAKIADPGNLGTLLRTAAAMNKRSVVLVSTVDPYSPKVVQASAGCIAYLDIFRLDWETLLKAKTKQNLKLIALVVQGGKNPEMIDFNDSLLVVGSEAHGIPEAWLDTCDELMTLPMPGSTESLNAAVAGSIALYVSCQKKA